MPAVLMTAAQAAQWLGLAQQVFGTSEQLWFEFKALMDKHNAATDTTHLDELAVDIARRRALAAQEAKATE